jgi:RimJ/RimL family protein N-acetyltransferase
MSSSDSHNISIRKATEGDLMLYFNWANDPLVRMTSFFFKPIEAEEHNEWFSKKLNDDNACLYVLEKNSKHFGQVRFEITNIIVVSISVDVNFRGQGLASKMLSLAIKTFHENYKGDIYAYIRKDNLASIKIFEKTGFVYLEDQVNNNIDCLVYVRR